MAFSAHKDAEQMQEFQCNEATLENQAAELARLIRSSQHLIAFTGAGISTSSGIPDFRGPQGVWTLRAKGEFPKSRQSTLSAVPTTAHMALVGLEQAGLLKFLVSQNTDGLHRRSGFPSHKLAELHGNSNLEQCRNCKKEYLRDFPVRTAGGVHDHQTNRKCAVCGYWLFDTIINFSESLPEKPLRDSFANGRRADVCMVLGSSLTVSPANRIPQETVENNGKLVICNMQRTPLDSLASLRVFSKTDALMEKLQNHSKNFVDPESGAHTNTVERMWRSSKKRNKIQSGTARHHLPAYLEEFWWRNSIKNSDPFGELLTAIAKLYPPKTYSEQ